MGKKRIVTKAGEDISKIATKITEFASKTPKKQVEKGRIYIKCSYNNTIVTLTDLNGNVIATSSAGALGFRGPQKATPYAATKVVESLLEKVKKIGLKTVEIFIQGVGGGRKASILALANKGIDIDLVKDITPIPHNGPRPPKIRRV